jgi:hypothetical protein
VPPTTVGHQARWVIPPASGLHGIWSVLWSAAAPLAALGRCRFTSPMARRAGLSRSIRTTTRTTRPPVDSGGCLRDTLACAAAFGAPKLCGSSAWMQGLSRRMESVQLTQVDSYGGRGGDCSAKVTLENFACSTPTAVTTLMPECRQGAVQERPRRRGGGPLRGSP